MIPHSEQQQTPAGGKPLPVVMGKPCTECGAFITRLGREGVFCSHSNCPHPKLGPDCVRGVWGEVKREGVVA